MLSSDASISYDDMTMFEYDVLTQAMGAYCALQALDADCITNIVNVDTGDMHGPEDCR